MFNRFRRHQPTPQEQAIADAEADLKAKRERLATDEARRREAGRQALTLTERRQRIQQAKVGTAAVKTAAQATAALKRDPHAQAEADQYAHEVEVARLATVTMAQEAAQLLVAHLKATGDKPRYTFDVKNTRHHTAANPDDGDPVQNVKGWLLFDEARSHSIRNYPTLQMSSSRWLHFYHGPVLLESGEIIAFNDLEDTLGPGLKPPHRSLRLSSDEAIQTMDYERYRAFYAPEQPIVAEYETQQAMADLLERHGVA